MSLTFYFAPMSTSNVTEAVLAELGIDGERVRLDIDRGDTRTSAFRAINPNGRVPVIVHDGVAIWESSAITIYLGEVFGVAAGLYPEQGPRRGEALKWIAWASATLAEAASRFAAALPAGSQGGVQAGSVDIAPPDERNAGALERAQRDVSGCLDTLDAALTEKPFLLGDYSLADTHLQVLVGWIGAMGLDLNPFPRTCIWLDACATRPALASLA